MRCPKCQGTRLEKMNVTFVDRGRKKDIRKMKVCCSHEAKQCLKCGAEFTVWC